MSLLSDRGTCSEKRGTTEHEAFTSACAGHRTPKQYVSLAGLKVPHTLLTALAPSALSFALDPDAFDTFAEKFPGDTRRTRRAGAIRHIGTVLSFMRPQDFAEIVEKDSTVATWYRLHLAQLLECGSQMLRICEAQKPAAFFFSDCAGFQAATLYSAMRKALPGLRLPPAMRIDPHYLKSEPAILKDTAVLAGRPEAKAFMARASILAAREETDTPLRLALMDDCLSDPEDSHTLKAVTAIVENAAKTLSRRISIAVYSKAIRGVLSPQPAALRTHQDLNEPPARGVMPIHCSSSDARLQWLAVANGTREFFRMNAASVLQHASSELPMHCEITTLSGA